MPKPNYFSLNICIFPFHIQSNRAVLFDCISYLIIAPRITSSFAHVNWEHMSARRIYNLGRALTSVYPLFTTWNMEPVKLFDVGLCEEVNNITVLGMPGFVVYDRLDLLIKVRCADGQWVSVKNVAMHNKRPISARDFNNGYIKKQKMEHRVFR